MTTRDIGVPPLWQEEIRRNPPVTLLITRGDELQVAALLQPPSATDASHPARPRARARRSVQRWERRADAVRAAMVFMNRGE
jgi:hypothetical protein